jgi:hypothetical protein
MWMTILQERSWWCPMCGWHGWGMMWMWIFWLVVLAAAVVVAAAPLRRMAEDRSVPPRIYGDTHSNAAPPVRRGRDRPRDLPANASRPRRTESVTA